MATGTGPNLGTTVHTVGGKTTTTSYGGTLSTPTTNTVTLFSAGASGSRINQVRITQLTTSTATGLVQFWLYNGTTYFAWDAYLYAANTVSTTAQPLSVDLIYQQLIIPSGYSLVAGDSNSTTSGASFSINVIGADF